MNYATIFAELGQPEGKQDWIIILLCAVLLVLIVKKS